MKPPIKNESSQQPSQEHKATLCQNGIRFDSVVLESIPDIHTYILELKHAQTFIVA